MKLSRPSRYESSPKPMTDPLHLGAISETWRYSSRARIQEMCTSTTGVRMPPIASAIAIEVWV